MKIHCEQVICGISYWTQRSINRLVKSRFAETLTLNSNFGESGRHQQAAAEVLRNGFC